MPEKTIAEEIEAALAERPGAPMCVDMVGAGPARAVPVDEVERELRRGARFVDENGGRARWEVAVGVLKARREKAALAPALAAQRNRVASLEAQLPVAKSAAKDDPKAQERLVRLEAHLEGQRKTLDDLDRRADPGKSKPAPKKAAEPKPEKED